MLRHKIDRIVFREGQLFIHGWGFYPGGKIETVVLFLDLVGQTDSIQFDVKYGQQRDDVKAFFPSVPEAGNSGFLLLSGYIQQEITRAWLCWNIAGHCSTETPLDISQLTGTKKIQNIANSYSYIFWKSVALIRTSGVSALIKKVKHRVRCRIRQANSDDLSQLCNKLRGRPFSIVVDHDLGGGTNIYREKIVSEQYAKGETVLVLGFAVSTLQYFVEVIDKTISCRYLIDSPERILALASVGELHQVMFNGAVSFRYPLTVIELLVELKKKYASCTLNIAVHDYFIICPSHFLINMHGNFCGVPEVTQCEQCLQQHRDDFVSLGGTRDINHWRNSWANLFKIADEIRMFSESSRRLLKKAYPTLSDSTWTVVPHVLPVKLHKVHLAAGQQLHIGIIGAIEKHKGANIVRDLASEIIQRNSDAKITVIGTLDSRVDDEVVTVTGPYEPSQLARYIEKSGANVFFLPSVVSETFSYVAHELVEMEVPFACFDIGAPADLARTYARGLVVHSMKAGNILTELELLWHETYQTTV